MLLWLFFFSDSCKGAALLETAAQPEHLALYHGTYLYVYPICSTTQLDILFRGFTLPFIWPFTRYIT